MSASKLNNTDSLRSLTGQSQPSHLSLSAGAVQIRRNGIEFRSGNPIPLWTEMTVDLQTTLDPRKFHCTGVVVACNGNRHGGYAVSMVFMSLSKQLQTRLNSMAFSALA
jgi:hypothetical protein